MREMLRNQAVEPIRAERFRPTGTPHFSNTEQFIEAKIKMLQEDFRIYLTKDDIEYIRKFKTESEINSAVKIIINRHWED